ncbi:poly(R)-hydroxyalkanoic acid synthase subunit PhaE [Cycloclasticus pugetii]|jgi:hypothetical protein|uniref:poly(R)-hydroxyalkanoic acid synthase subunit PhaE n=1 Tax=Cycloclasticus pugetii TaxID=34068 RepID=UPI00240A106F|nr:poly(R)-hydroxyalkanoic acid synthase subunit PhaE [Cycloclasticus pugetii]MDF1828511.1 poly(R)-hydroxyalkanoic acid synthase subunit PhaE [Cycloclasticus pugetii]
MTTDTKNPYTQFFTLMNSKLPDEYKAVLQKFQEHGDFYQQLINNVNNNETDLSKFWDLPSTLGFNTASNPQTKWLQSFFSLNNFQSSTDTQLIQQFTQAICELPLQAQENLSSIQAALSKLNQLYAKLSQSAMKHFQALKDESPDASNEQLCIFWLTAGEKAFSEISQTDDYINAQKKLFESLNNLKNTQHAFSEQAAELFGLPTQQSLEDLQNGLHKLRMEFAEYKAQTDEVINELRQTIYQLK